MSFTVPGRVGSDLRKRLISVRLHVPCFAARVENDSVFAASPGNSSANDISLNCTAFVCRRYAGYFDRWLTMLRCTATEQGDQQPHSRLHSSHSRATGWTMWIGIHLPANYRLNEDH